MPKATIPARVPQMTKEEIIARILKEYPKYVIPKMLIVGIRGYYKKTLGNPDINDRRIYDDAIFLVSDKKFQSFNANCDPGAFEKGIANLNPGIWPAYKFDLHKGKYLALCQRAAKVTVHRDDKGDDTGMFGINIHKGGINTVSSLGCQTIPPTQWEQFIIAAQNMGFAIFGLHYKKLTYTYILFEN